MAIPSSNFTTRLSDDSDDDECDDDDDPEVSVFNRSKRYLLSTSLDVDPRIPYKSELRGLPPGLASRSAPPKQSRAQDHQTILVTSMLMGLGEGRESKVRTHSHSTEQYRTVQNSTEQNRTVQYSTVQYSTVQYSTVQYSTVQYSTVQYSTVEYSTVLYCTIL